MLSADLALRPTEPWRAASRADTWLVLGPLLVMVVMWTIVPALVHAALPLDVMESAMWGREGVIGTYKHPGMPSWFIEAGRGLSGGRVGWPVYATGQLFDLVTLGLTYLLARDLLGARVATVAVLSLLGVEYFSWRSVEFNHTQAQMPFWIAAAWCALRAVQHGGRGWWLALGATAALGLYAKLSNAFELLVIAGWIVSTPRGRAAVATVWPWAGAGLFVVLSIPLLWWLIGSDFQPFTYAHTRGQESSAGILGLVVATALQFAPAVAVLGLAIGWAGLSRPFDVSHGGMDGGHREAWRFLAIVAVAPPLLLLALAVVEGSGVRATWIAPAMPLFAVMLAGHWATRIDDRVVRRMATIGLGLAVLLPLGYGLIAPRIGALGRLPPLRVSWPQADIARALSAVWTAETGRPLRIVAGSAWSAGLVGVDHSDRPSILTEGKLAFSPWITPERLAREGALAVWTEGRGAIAMPVLERLVAGLPVRELRLPIAHAPASQGVVIRYAIIPPR